MPSFWEVFSGKRFVCCALIVLYSIYSMVGRSIVSISDLGRLGSVISAIDLSTVLYIVLCIIYSIEGRLICQIADRGRLDIDWGANRRVRYRKRLRANLAGWYTVYQTCPPYIKPVRPYLSPRGAEVRAIWHINRASVLHTIYQVLVTLRLTVYGENSPVSAAVRRRPFWRLICHYNKLAHNT